jgi:hypothetical protein
MIERMKAALRLIGYSGHSNSPRFGEKAQIARWGLGEDILPPGIKLDDHRLREYGTSALRGFSLEDSGDRGQNQGE